MVDGLKEAALLSFFKGVLINDDEGRLEMPGPNSRSARFMKFRSVAEIAAAEEIIRAYIRQAVENERLGRKVEEKRESLRQKRRDIEETLIELDNIEESCLNRLAEIGVNT